MARDFVAVDRGQLLLMPPSLTEWLPEDHLVWTVLGAVEVMDLSRFEECYRMGAAGRAPYDPAMMVALLMYCYARGNRSSRGIERACWEDVAVKVITSLRTPDHSAIAEFRRRHEAEIGELFDDVLGICREAGLVSVGVITIDGTKIKANASMDQNRSYSGLVKDILREAEETDRREDELYGDDRGDELPEQLRSPETRRQALADAKRRLAERKGRPADDEANPEPEKLEMDLEAAVLTRPVLRRGGRIEWLRVARRGLEAHRTRQGAPVPRDRDDRMIGALERFEENHQVDLAAVETYERWRVTARDTKGRVMKGNSKPFVAPELPEGKINLSDPDSRVMRTQGTPPRQAYNAQAVVNDQQVILAAEITNAAPDFGQLAPMFEATMRELSEQGVTETPEVVLADAGYWHHPQMQSISEQGIEVLVPPDGNMRDGKRRGWEEGVYQQMRDKLSTDRGRELYAQRKITIEPVFGQIKYNRHIDPVHAKRPTSRPIGVAVSHRDAQPAEAPQPLDREPRLTPSGSLLDRRAGLLFDPRGSRSSSIPHIPTASRRRSRPPGTAAGLTGAAAFVRRRSCSRAPASGFLTAPLPPDQQPVRNVPVMFGAGRSVGWLAQWHEMVREPLGQLRPLPSQLLLVAAVDLHISLMSAIRYSESN